MNPGSAASLAAANVRIALMRRGVIMSDDDAAEVRRVLLAHVSERQSPPEPVDPDAPTERIPEAPPADPDRVKRKG